MGSRPDEISLRDERRTHRFWIDDVVIDTYGAQIGPYGIAIYAYLSRRAKASKAFPGQRRIAKETNISRQQVINTLRVLEAVGLLDIEKRLTDSGDADTNIYTLKDLSHLHTIGGTLDRPPGTLDRPPGTLDRPPGTLGRPRVVHQVDHGGTPGRPEGFSFKDSLLEEELKPPTPFQGDAPTGENGTAPGKGKRQGKHADASPEALTVRDYLNQVNGRRYTTATQIDTLLQSGVTGDDCRLVIDFGFAVLRHERHDWYEQYFDNVTPFRQANFDKYRARAELWHAKGRTAISTPPYDLSAWVAQEEAKIDDSTRD